MMISFTELLMILVPIILAFLFYVIRIERSLVRINTELKNIKARLA